MTNSKKPKSARPARTFKAFAAATTFCLRLHPVLLLCAPLFLLPTRPARGADRLRHFVTVRGDQLFEGKRPFRFISFNIPNLHLVEDNVAFARENAWRWPDQFEISDALESIRQQGGLVTRTYVLSVQRTNDSRGVPRHVLGPGQFNEEGFQVLDQVLQIAHQKGIRVIIPFVDNWSWWGGIAEYAAFRRKPKEAFWTDRQIIDDFKQTVRFLVTRTNSLTGVPYRKDKAILCWETGNEVLSPPPWTREIAAYIHQLDPIHPVMDGFHTTELRPESLAMPEIDIVTTHHYPGGNKSFADLIRSNAANAKSRKPYVVGEFGFVSTAQMAEAISAVSSSGSAGALAWSLRYRNRDGGFYWHSEPAGGDKYKAFHWPGFTTGADYDEAQFMNLMQREAYAIRDLPVPKPRPPAPAHLLPANSAALSWQGSAGATTYQVQRAASPRGPWKTVSPGVDETAVQYRPLFVDTNCASGSWFYRIRASNSGGPSRPSNVIGPVSVTQRLLVDELADSSLITKTQGPLKHVSNECRKAREDIHRLAGEPGSAITYRLPAQMLFLRIYSFFPEAVAEFRVSVSADGQDFTPISAKPTTFFGGSGDYGYWKPVLTESAVPTGGNARWVRIEYGAQAQIGRIEIEYALHP